MVLFTIWPLLACLTASELVLARGKIIDIFNGEDDGDILQLQGEPRFYSDDKFHNALFNNSQRKWNVKDSNGNTVIPYIISGSYGNRK
uniref:Secreted protein n=1 Tax=Angiostrongylus cantonensis TaxID=6313 RepID=A0A0K0DBK1_ANGCA